MTLLNLPLCLPLSLTPFCPPSSLLSFSLLHFSPLFSLHLYLPLSFNPFSPPSFLLSLSFPSSHLPRSIPPNFPSFFPLSSFLLRALSTLTLYIFLYLFHLFPLPTFSSSSPLHSPPHRPSLHSSEFPPFFTLLSRLFVEISEETRRWRRW